VIWASTFYKGNKPCRSSRLPRTSSSRRKSSSGDDRAMLQRAILSTIAWVCLVCACAAQPLSFPALTGRVVDEAGLMDAATRTALTEQLAGLEQKTTDQLVVVTLKSLQGTSIEDYGYQLGRHWQIGQKDKNNGVLLIVAANERKVRIEVGYGLEGTLTDAVTKLIIESSILPRFKSPIFPAASNVVSKTLFRCSAAMRKSGKTGPPRGSPGKRAAGPATSDLAGHHCASRGRRALIFAPSEVG